MDPEVCAEDGCDNIERDEYTTSEVRNMNRIYHGKDWFEYLFPVEFFQVFQKQVMEVLEFFQS